MILKKEHKIMVPKNTAELNNYLDTIKNVVSKQHMQNCRNVKNMSPEQ